MGEKSLETVTLIVPFYRNAGMLERQVLEWNAYPDGLKIVVVDDGSPEPALPIIQQHLKRSRLKDLQLFRINVDIPWNREGARNLGATTAQTDWIVHVDIDHVLPANSAAALLDFEAQPQAWYRFPRWRVGRADATRRKDKIPDSVEFGQIHPHIDSYLLPRRLYWETGGYDEDYAGCLGGGSAFLRRLESLAGRPHEMPAEICLHVYTRDRIKDASDWSLSRDTSPGKDITRVKVAQKNTEPKKPLRFQWTRQL